MKTFGNHRQAGILMPISALPGAYGIGDIGEAYQFVDLLSQSGLKIWQILPLNPIGNDNSPYSPFSSYAGDEIYIDLEALYHQGLIEELPEKIETDFVDYTQVRALKRQVLKEAFAHFKADQDYVQFCQQAEWLEGYASYMAMKGCHKGLWQTWEDRDYDDDAYDFICFVQYVFYKQWMKLKHYVNEKGIKIVGDIPIYVGLDSADVFASPKNFQLNQDGYPSSVAGVPPDYFNDQGQLWGNPLYNWDYQKKNHYDFWVKRLAWSGRLYDYVRIDHFRAFDTYWSIPTSSMIAKEGHWEFGPAYDLFDTIDQRCPDLVVIAEDLGDLRPEVLELRDHYHMLGMRIVQYSFGEKEKEENYELPENCIAYTGTHDNSPLKGWYQALPEDEKKHVEDILKMKGRTGQTINERVIRHALAQPSILAVIQMQDILSLGEETRMNNPGTASDKNWSWKMVSLEPFQQKLPEIYQMIKEANRL